MLRGEAQGWLNATCMYYGLGWLQPDQGRQVLKRDAIDYCPPNRELELDDVKAAALARDPGCKAIWPEALNEGG